jgi:transporter family protein
MFLIPYTNLKLSLPTLVLIYITSLIATIGIVFRVKALRHMDVSVVAPLMNIDPIFVMILAFFFLGETIAAKQIFGVIIIVFGAYLLEANGNIRHFTAPIKEMWKSKYTHYIIFAVFLFSIEATIEKNILTNYAPVFSFLFYFWIFVFLNFMLISIMRYDGVNQLKRGLREGGYWIFTISILAIVSSFLFMKAIFLGPISLFVSIKRISSVFSTFLGGELFHEKFLKIRLICALIMFVGAYLVLV